MPRNLPKWLRLLGAVILEWLYPPKCGLCGRIGRQALCSDCLAEFKTVDWENPDCQPPLAYHVALFEFSGRAAQAVRRLKFERITPLAEPLASQVLKGCTRFELLSCDHIIPVPIHRTRENVRGFNQSVLLSAQLPAEKLNPRLLTRIRATKPQVRLKREERLTNLKGAFQAAPEVAGKTILLIDDVYTSGGTAVACAEALFAAGAVEVGIFTLTTGAATGDVEP